MLDEEDKALLGNGVCNIFLVLDNSIEVDQLSESLMNGLAESKRACFDFLWTASSMLEGLPGCETYRHLDFREL